MEDVRIRIRVNRSAGELELEGPPKIVAEWWDRVWPELRNARIEVGQSLAPSQPRLPGTTESGGLPDLFGEFFSEFRSDITDVDRVLVAGAYIQGKDADRSFTTKSANQLLLDQNVKVANASECVRRLTATKRVFVVSDGRFRVSAGGLEHLRSLRVNP